jgi:hypothetical protein
MGSNHRRLSRRFYSPSLLSQSKIPELRIRHSRRCTRAMWCAICPCARSPGRREFTDGHGPRGGSGIPTVPVGRPHTALASFPPERPASRSPIASRSRAYWPLTASGTAKPTPAASAIAIKSTKGGPGLPESWSGTGSAAGWQVNFRGRRALPPGVGPSAGGCGDGRDPVRNGGGVTLADKAYQATAGQRSRTKPEPQKDANRAHAKLSHWVNAQTLLSRDAQFRVGLTTGT